MERATHIDKDGWYINGANVATVFHSGTGEIRMRGKDIDCLAAIEDILGDEYDLDRLSAMVNQRMTMREEVAERWKLTCNIPLDRLRELAHADREGRIHIYRRSYKCPICGAYRLIPRVDRQFYFCFHCKSQVSREEAEAALRGEQE